MGRQKFYKNPVGRVRAELLISSGEQFSVGSVEFRLCREHFSRKLAFDIQFKEEILCRVSEISLLTKVKTLADINLTEEHKRAMDRVDSIVSIIDPLRNEYVKTKNVNTKKSDDTNRLAYLEALTQGKPFTSLREIVSSITKLNDYIATNNANT